MSLASIKGKLIRAEMKKLWLDLVLSCVNFYVILLVSVFWGMAMKVLVFL